MNTKATTGTLATLAAFLGVTVVVLAMQTHTLRSKLQEVTEQKSPATPVRPKANNTDVAALRRQLAEREAAYFQLEDQYRELQRRTEGAPEMPASFTPPSTPNATNNPSGRGGRGGWGGGSGWMERLKTEDPERYKQIMAEREQRRKQADDWFQNQTDALAQRAQNAASPDEATVAKQLADTLSKINDLRQQFQQARSLPEDQAQVAMEQLGPQMRDAYQQLTQLSQQDRQLQLANLGKSVGYSDPSAFVNNVTAIYSNTNYGTILRNLGGMGGRGGGGPR